MTAMADSRATGAEQKTFDVADETRTFVVDWWGASNYAQG